MKKVAVIGGNICLFCIIAAPALAQGGDPVPGPTPVVTPTQVQTPTAPQPSFLQTLQQQQQIQNTIQNLQFPAYLQANPAISPLDQRSGLTNEAIKTINLTPTGLSITTVKAPNIVNSNLLAPTTTVTNVSPGTPITTPATNTAKPDFSSLSTLLDNLSKIYGSPQDVKTTVTSITPPKPAVTTTTTTTTTTTVPKSTTPVATTTSVGVIPQVNLGTVQINTEVKPVSTTNTGGGLQSNVIPGKNFIEQLTNQYLNFPSLTTPQDRQNTLVSMVTTFKNLTQMGLLPKTAGDDLNKLATIAKDPNSTAIKTSDSTTARFYISNIMTKLVTSVSGMDTSKITIDAINNMGSIVGVDDILKANNQALQNMQELMKEKEAQTRTQNGTPAAIRDLQNGLTNFSTTVNNLGATPASGKAAAQAATVQPTAKPAPQAASQSTLNNILSTLGISSSAAKIGTAAAKAVVPVAQPTQKQAPQAPPAAPTVNLVALQNDFNSATNTLGTLNAQLDAKMVNLASVNSGLQNTTPTATNKMQIDMLKSQQQRLQADINTLRSDKAMAESKFVTAFSKMYGADAATKLSQQISGFNPDTKSLQSIAAGVKP